VVSFAIYATASDLAVSTSSGEAGMVLFLSGRESVDLFDFRFQGRPVLTGTSIGTSCANTVFRDGGADFATATAPYAGTFAPLGDASTGTNFDRFIGHFAYGAWDLGVYNLDGPVTVECMELKLRVH
jgi:hypothetical protein